MGKHSVQPDGIQPAGDLADVDGKKKVPLNVALDADPKRSLSVQLEQKEAARAFCLDSAVGGWRETVGTASDPNRCNQFRHSREKSENIESEVGRNYY